MKEASGRAGANPLARYEEWSVFVPSARHSSFSEFRQQWSPHE